MIGLQKQNYTSSLMAVGLGLLLGFSPVADATQKKGNACDVASTEVPVNWLPGAPSAYKGQIIVRDDKSALIVALSSNASLNFFKEPIRQTTIYMMDGYSSYYTRSAGKIVGAISLYAKTHGYRKIVFIGSSKGGFGALLFGALLSVRRNHPQIAVIAWSPQTRLYPVNEALFFPSYKKFMTVAGRDKSAVECLEAYGDIATVLKKGRVIAANVIYGERNAVDTAEAKRLEGLPGVVLTPLPISIHGAVLPYTILNHARLDFEEGVRQTYEKAMKDPDLRASLPQPESALADEFRALRHLPEVPALIEITIRGMNSPRSAENLDMRPAAPVTGVPYLLQRSP